MISAEGHGSSQRSHPHREPVKYCPQHFTFPCLSHSETEHLSGEDDEREMFFITTWRKKDSVHFSLLLHSDIFSLVNVLKFLSPTLLSESGTAQ